MRYNQMRPIPATETRTSNYHGIQVIVSDE